MTTPLQSVRAGSGVSPNWVNGRPITMSNADLNPADVGAMMKRANAAFSARHMSEAACHYREVLAVSPNDAHALHHLALACVHTNAIDDANAHIGLALKAAPERAELWEHAGLIAALKREYVHAEACYQRAIDITGSTATLHRNLADCLRQLGRLPEAKPHYKIAIDLEPELHHAIRALARISKELGEIDDAADYWLRTWLIGPTCLADGLDLIAALKNAGRRGEIDAIAEKMESIFASDPSALGELAHALICADCFHKAGRVGKRGLEVDPHNANLHHQVTYAFTLLGAFAEMRAHSIEAARLSPGNVFMQYNLATTHLRLGDFLKAGSNISGSRDYPTRRRLIVRPPLSGTVSELKDAGFYSSANKDVEIKSSFFGWPTGCIEKERLLTCGFASRLRSWRGARTESMRCGLRSRRFRTTTGVACSECQRICAVTSPHFQSPHATCRHRMNECINGAPILAASRPPMAASESASDWYGRETLTTDLTATVQ
jgi:tetratricopeptide (TPR) repeat protein